MKALSISNSLALKIYPTAIPELKAILEDNFPKDFFNGKITDRVKTFEDACNMLGLDEEDVYTNSDTVDEMAYKKLKVIVNALNEGWKPNWNNDNEKKWRPWFYLNSPGFRFLGPGCGSTLSHVGSRLCFKSEELCIYAAKQFIELYKDLFTA